MASDRSAASRVSGTESRAARRASIASGADRGEHGGTPPHGSGQEAPLHESCVVTRIPVGGAPAPSPSLSTMRAGQLPEELEESTRGLSDQVPVELGRQARPSARSRRDQVPVDKLRFSPLYKQGCDQLPVVFSRRQKGLTQAPCSRVGGASGCSRFATGGRLWLRVMPPSSAAKRASG